MQPPETTQLTVQLLVEQDRLLDQSVEESTIANSKEELLRLMISNYTNTTDSMFHLSRPTLSEAKQAQTALKEQKELIDETNDELVEGGDISTELVMERFDEIYNKQREIVKLFQSIKDNLY